MGATERALPRVADRQGAQAVRRSVHQAAKAISASAAPPKTAVSISCSGQKWLAG